MNDIRLEEASFSHNGKEYILRCNMNVLADVQQEYNGDISTALYDRGKIGKSILVFLAAMMNDYADEQGWEERYTAKQLGRELSPRNTPMETVVKLVTDALFVKKDGTKPTEESSKN